MQEEQACLTCPEIDVMAEIRKSQTAIISALRQEFTGLPVALGGALQAMQATAFWNALTRLQQAEACHDPTV